MFAEHSFADIICYFLWDRDVVYSERMAFFSINLSSFGFRENPRHNTSLSKRPVFGNSPQRILWTNSNNAWVRILVILMRNIPHFMLPFKASRTPPGLILFSEPKIFWYFDVVYCRWVWWCVDSGRRERRRMWWPANHGKQEHAGKAELTSQTSLRLTEHNYIKDIIGEKGHMTSPPHNILSFDVCSFVVLSILSIYLVPARETQVQQLSAPSNEVNHERTERCGPVFAMDERASGRQRW